MAFILGITGGIGAGKTAATDRLLYHHIEVVDADVIARAITPPGSHALTQIVAHFGGEMLSADGSMNREALRSRIFADARAKTWLEHLLHPLIRREIKRQLQAAQSPYVVLSAPLLLETGLHQLTDRVLVIDIDENTQVSRTSGRDAIPEEQVRNIIRQQISRERRLSMADDVITNNGSLAELHLKIDRYHGELLAKLENNTLRSTSVGHN